MIPKKNTANFVSSLFSNKYIFVFMKKFFPNANFFWVEGFDTVRNCDDMITVHHSPSTNVPENSLGLLVKTHKKKYNTI